MTQTFSKSRAQAEAAFAKAQSPFFSRSQGLEENEAIAHARDEKTARLRAAREAKESKDQATATAGMLAKRAKP